MAKDNVKVVLRARPETGKSVETSHFHTDKSEFNEEMKDGEVTVELLCLSVDPYMRCRFNASTGADYMGPFIEDQPIRSGGVVRVIESRSDDYKPGDVLVAQMEMPWQKFMVWDPKTIPDLQKLMQGLDPMLAVSLFGIAGLSAFHCVEQCKPVSGEICVLSSCAGAVGSIAGQLLRKRGVKVIGICGSKVKCDWSKENGIADVCLSYRDPEFDSQLKKACDGKVNFYFDNVGGTISEKVILEMVPKGRIIVCGQISSYDQDTTREDYVYPDPLPEEIAKFVKEKEITRDRFFVGWYAEGHPEAMRKLQAMAEKGELIVPVHWIDGLENAGDAFVEMMNGKHQGKVMVRVVSEKETVSPPENKKQKTS